MNPPDNDSSLRPALLAWQVSPPADPGFRSAILARIEEAREWADLTWAGYLGRHPLAWVLALGAVAAGAGALGLGAGARHSAADRERVLASYVAAIDVRAMEP
jgi:hypothetical protein